ncbi:DUF2000 domain-containing protein [Spirosoma endophyticum]|uniref:DUF2000 domain-containing protein n=1 Tax=Spirosoma endophyticum TaxID=662367 RepID=A0A1I2DWF9_9BACT|nr:DUF2000 domain-containing protein [Spirosoma endophyticum]SFE84563.1 hypothetical protein SAMN05216167_12088 [Spirosoma endophyticum]
MYDKKVAIVVLNELLAWQKLNVVSFLAGSVAIQFPETHGEPFTTSDQVNFLPFSKHPTLIYKADSTDKLHRALHRARDRDLAIGIYTRPLFETRSGEENIVEIARHSVDALDLVGLVVYGDNKKVDKALDGLKFHD